MDHEAIYNGIIAYLGCLARLEDHEIHSIIELLIETQSEYQTVRELEALITDAIDEQAGK